MKQIAVVLILATCGFAQISTDFFGHSINQMSTPWPSDIGLQSGRMRTWDAGGGLSWKHIEASNGAFSWSKFDAYVGKAKAHGQKVLYTIGRTPEWANPSAPNPSSPCGYSTHACQPPSDLASNGSGTNAAFRGFVTALAAHIADKGFGGTVDQFEIWNEVNNNPFWQGTPEQLTRMTIDAETIIHQKLPGATILTPSTCNCSGSVHLSGGNAAAMNTLLGTSYNGVAMWQKVGGIAAHLYLGSQYPEKAIGLIDGYMAMSNRHNLPLVNTECSWGPNKYASLGINPGSTACSATDMGHNVNTASCMNAMVAWVARSLIIQVSKGVKSYDWYQMDNTSSGGGGTLWYNGSKTKAGIAYGNVYKWLIGSTPNGCSQSGSVFTCSFTMANGAAGKAIWAQSTTPSTVTMPWSGRVLKLDGTAVGASSGAKVTITQQPVWITNSMTVRRLHRHHRHHHRKHKGVR